MVIPCGRVAAAFVGGLSFLIRVESVLVIFLCALLFSKSVANFFAGKTRFVLLVLCFLLLPWSVWIARNAKVHHHFIPFTTEGAWAFYMGQVYHPDESYTVADPTAIKMIVATPVEYDWYRRMNHEALQAMLSHPVRNLGWALIKVRVTFLDYSENGLSLLYPLLWIAIPFVGLSRSRNRKWGVLAGSIVAFFHLKLGQWDPTIPMGLMHVGYRDVILPGAIGFSLMILRSKNDFWKILAAPFLTIVFCSAVFVSHYRERIFLCDWIFLIGTAFLISEAINFLEPTNSDTNFFYKPKRFLDT